jgi:hypothetical protein
MKNLLIFVVAVILNGCVVSDQVALQQKKSDLQKGAAASYIKADKESYQNETKFLDCMKNYGKAKASSSIGASDLAETAITVCNTPLTYYKMNRSSYYSMHDVMYWRGR